MKQITHHKTIHPVFIATQIWILTSLVFGAGWMLCSVFSVQDIDPGISIIATVAAALCSFPVMIVLLVAFPEIRDSNRTPVGKIKRLLLVCFMCTVPYALIAGIGFSNIYVTDVYFINYVLNVFVVTGILFSCSIAAMLVTGKTILLFFSQVQKPTYLPTQIGQQNEIK